MPKTTLKPKVQVRRENDFLRDAPEVSIFLASLGLMGRLRELEQSFSKGELRDRPFFNKFNAVLAQLTSIVEATERFDIVTPVLDYGHYSPFFWRWYNWWDDYFKGLSSKQIGQLDRLARARKPAVEDYRPDGDWVRYRQTPAFKLVFS